MKKINLSEESYNKLKKKLVNEITYGTLNNAYDRSERLFYELRTSFEDFYNSLNDAMFEAKCGRVYANGECNPYLEKIKKLAEPIYDILIRKGKQQDNFGASINKIDDSEFYSSEEGEENDIDDMDFNYLQKKFSV